MSCVRKQYSGGRSTGGHARPCRQPRTWEERLVDQAADGVQGMIGWHARLVGTMNASCCCSSPRLAPSIGVICRKYSISDGETEAGRPRPQTIAGRVGRRLFPQPAR